ncbi:LOW QUALITY PROTEIN: probable ATP-dependent RNA helicase DDX27 [Lethenteron reissneri]|uniref:LOW QUALITY PROTEIN: probable ATP-dependent RNA helicase DDX27 n=1 Tax=Lethenteron reissneri TaxID=7753 RepID=UPI002AB73744|nr:LOW QUALITY PROTEIN: probable ATP-dependent RNA helicase DDX27 [Lethenteron reissneri]
MADLDLVATIEDDDEVRVASEESDSGDDEDGTVVKKKKKKAQPVVRGRCADFSDDFAFMERDGEIAIDWERDIMLMAKKKRHATTLDEKIAEVRRKRKKADTSENDDKGKEDEDEGKEDGAKDVENGENEAESSEEGDDESDNEATGSSSDDDVQKSDVLKEKVKKKKKLKGEEKPFFEDAPFVDKNITFPDMNLSRPLLKAISSMGFLQPTPIQKSCIPVGLLGKDICACAATGTGKTAAFMLPVLERLVYKPRQAPVTRVLVLVPTRELGIQVHSVTRQLSQFCNVQTSLAVGGLDIKTQEAALRAGPDILIATPGRLIDHLQNCPSFDLSSIEILILDEADRMLDEYFEEQMKEIIRQCSHQRQTMLFSATMTDQVQDLAAVSLKHPVKIFVNSNTDVAPYLRQEFVRIRPNREGDREGIVSALLTRTFQDHVMVFTQTKKQAHRLHILLGLLGLRVGELHGNLSQTQRLEALRRFKDDQIDILVATDVAARGLDIEGVKTVINFTMPSTIKHYVHRVGRTARAGRAGRSISLVGETERRVLKDIVKQARSTVKSRVLPPEVVEKFRVKIENMEKDIYAVLRLEREDKELCASENQLSKAQKQLDGTVQDEAARTWFQTKKERMQEKARKALQQYDTALMGKKKRQEHVKELRKKQQTPEDRAQFEIVKAQMYAERTMKRSRKPKRARVMPEDLPRPKEDTRPTKIATFDRELTNTSRKALKQYRAGPTFDERKKLGMDTRRKGGKFKSKGRYKRK